MAVALNQIKSELRGYADPKKAAFFPRFFKAGPGEYGEGDKFLGVTVPNLRKIAKKYRGLPLADIEQLLLSPWHEERLSSLFILVGQFERGDQETKQKIYNFYISHSNNINNWDLVDSSAPYIAGAWLTNQPNQLAILKKLATSDVLWDRRIAMLATFWDIREGKPEVALQIAGILIDDKHDLIQKAVGWMLRELGKRCSKELLLSFLDEHYKTMPRTALRYAIEHFDQPTRNHYLGRT